MSSNAYQIFKSILATPPLQIGTVQSCEAGVCTIELPGGGLVQARGVYSYGALVFFRDGVIESQTTTLPVEVITI